MSSLGHVSVMNFLPLPRSEEVVGCVGEIHTAVNSLSKQSGHVFGAEQCSTRKDHGFRTASGSLEANVWLIVS